MTRDAKLMMTRNLLRRVAAVATQGALTGFAYLPSRHRPRRARDIRTLVFVHGLAGTRANFFPMQAYLAAVGHRRQYSFNYRSVGSVESLALRLKREIDENIRGGRVDIVAHSLGGLVARHYLQVLGGARRVDRLVTLATPHEGTHTSVYLPTSLVTQLRPGSPFLEHLNGLEPPPGLQCHSLAAEDDLIVLPATSGLARFGHSEIVRGVGHVDLLLSPSVFARVHARLCQPLESARPAPELAGAAPASRLPFGP